jgi:hypothetical protein
MEIPQEFKFKTIFETGVALMLNGKETDPVQAVDTATKLFERAVEQSKNSGIVGVHGQLSLVP